ncbi:hypothetical protein A2U01_0039236, partial [Trifolium medium]|nr:hypothetical protein [Trifolium medium]
GVVVLLHVASESWYGGGGDGRNWKARLIEIHQVRVRDARGESLGVRSGDGTYAGEENNTPKITGRMDSAVNNFMINPM